MTVNWKTYVGGNYQLYTRKDKPMGMDKHHRRHHLGNIKEWLRLAETPLEAAQNATAEALKAHWDTGDKEALFTLTDVAQTVNKILSLAQHTIDMVDYLLRDPELSPEPKPLPEMKSLGAYTCKSCDCSFDYPNYTTLAKVCPCCGSSDFDVTIPF